MSISELIAECEKLDAEATPGPWLHRSTEGGWDGVMSEQGHWICSLRYNQPGNATAIARSRTLLPLLVAVIKNQQRQIEYATSQLDSIHGILNQQENSYFWDMVAEFRDDDSIMQLKTIAAELEDVKP